MNTLTTNRNIKISFSIPEFSQATSIGRSKIYEEIKAGKLIARKIGKRSLITLDDGQEYLASLPRMDIDEK